MLLGNIDVAFQLLWPFATDQSVLFYDFIRVVFYYTFCIFHGILAYYTINYLKISKKLNFIRGLFDFRWDVDNWKIVYYRSSQRFVL